VYFRSHENDNVHVRAINAFADNVEKELDEAEEWTSFCVNVTALLKELRSLKTLGNAPNSTDCQIL